MALPSEAEELSAILKRVAEFHHFIMELPACLEECSVVVFPVDRHWLEGKHAAGEERRQRLQNKALFRARLSKLRQGATTQLHLCKHTPSSSPAASPRSVSSFWAPAFAASRTTASRSAARLLVRGAMLFLIAWAVGTDRSRVVRTRAFQSSRVFAEPSPPFPIAIHPNQHYPHIRPTSRPTRDYS